MDYPKLNAQTVDRWCREGWEWGQPISHETYIQAKEGRWGVYLTPTKTVPKEWFGSLHGKKVLGLASGGGQQIPVFTALGADCTVLDYSTEQCKREREVAQREGYTVTVCQEDMTKPLPFADETFDLIFHPVSNCYVKDVKPIFLECFRVLKKGGILLCGLDNGVNYIFDEEEIKVCYTLPFDPLSNPAVYDECMKSDVGIQFSHTLEEQIGGQLEAGLHLTNLYDDTNGEGNLHEHNIPSYVATRAVKPLFDLDRDLCPVCGRYVFENPRDICPLCGWQHDRVQEKDSSFAGGANARSLQQAREAYGKGDSTCED